MEFYNHFLQNFLNRSNNNLYSIIFSVAAVVAESFNRTFRGLLKRPVFERGEANCIDVLPTLTKQYKDRIHSSTKLPPIKAYLKKTKIMFTKLH